MHMGHDRINKKEEKKDLAQEGQKGDILHRVLVLGLSPTFVFFFMVLIIAVSFNYFPATILMFCAFAFMASVLVALLFQRKRWQKWLGVFFILAVTGGVMAGFTLYYRHMVYFFHYRDAPKYTNVAAMQPAIMFEDAGMVKFKQGTVVDRTRSLGYQSATAGVTLCLAPVVDNSMEGNAEVSFFAVGINCCDWRARFWCDDAESADGDGGALLHFDADQIVSPLTAWMLESPVTRENFKPVFDLAKATFGLHIAQSTRLLRWTKDPVKLKDSYWYHCLLELAVLTLVAGAFFFTGGFLAVLGERRIKSYVMKNFTRRSPGSKPDV